jgi:Fic/DOC family
MAALSLLSQGCGIAAQTGLDLIRVAFLANYNRSRRLIGVLIVDSLTTFLAVLNAIHPFRDRNGRTQLAFLALLAARAGHTGVIDGEGLTREAGHALAGFAVQTFPRHGHLSLNWISGAASRKVILM